MFAEPSFAKEYPWLTEHWQQLCQQLANDRLPHAMLWVAPEGIGIDALAQAFLALLMCQSSAESIACGNCSSCQLLQAGTHPDFHHLTIEEKKRDISIEQIRTLISHLNERPHQNGRRLVFLEPAHAMSRATANAFLKTLEEPGDDTVLILLTSRLDAINATIRSRCQTLHFHSPTEAETIDYILGQLPGEQDAAKQAARLSKNRPVAAVTLIETGVLEARRNFFAYQTAMLTKQMDPLSYAVKEKSPDAVIQLTDWLLELLLDVEKYASGISLNNLMNPDQEDLLKILVSKEPALRMQWQNRLVEYKRTMRNATNVNPQLTMESLLSGWIAFLSD